MPDLAPIARLTIHSELDRYEFLLEEPTGAKTRGSSPSNPALLESLHRVGEDLGARIWLKPPTGTVDRLRACGQLLGESIPTAVRLRLLDLEGEPMAITTDETPWELAELDGRPLAFRHPWARSTRAAPLAPPPGEPRGLLIGDPDGTLPQAASATAAMAEILKPRMEVEHLHGERATRLAVTTRLRDPDYSFLVLTGNLTFPGEGRLKTSSCLYLADGPLELGELELLLRQGAPRIILANYSLVGECPFALGPEPWSRVFLNAGCWAVVHNRWNAPHVDATYLDLVERLAGGSTLGAALLEALDKTYREHTDDPYASGLCLTAHGDPQLTLPEALERSATAGTLLSPELLIRITGGPDAGLEIPLFAQVLESCKSVFIGSPGLRVNEVELEDPALDNRMACLKRAGEQLMLVNLSGDRSRVRVNGLPVGESVPVEGGDIVEMGDSTLVFERSGGTPVGGRGGTPPRQYLLRVVSGDDRDRGKEFALGPGLSIVGRRSDCTVQVHDLAVSRQHFALVERNGLYFLSHLGSNPTIVNGVAVQGERELSPGDQMRISDRTVLELCEQRSEGA